jgi:hypothetical protein
MSTHIHTLNENEIRRIFCKNLDFTHGGGFGRQENVDLEFA